MHIPLAHRSPIHALGTDGQGRIISYGGDDLLRSWDATTGAPGTFTAPFASVSTRLVGFAGHLVVAVDSRGLHRFDAAGTPVPPTASDWGLVTSRHGQAALLTTGDGGLVAVGGYGGRVHRWDAVSGEPVGPPWNGHAGRERALALLRLPDGRAVVVSAGEELPLQRWDAVTGEPAGEPLTGLEVPAELLAGAAETVVAQTSTGSLHRWDVVTGAPIGRPLLPPVRGAGGLALTPDARMLLSLDGDGTPWLWDLTLDEPAPHALPVTGVDVITAIGSLFVTGDSLGRMRRWDTTGRAVGDALSGHPGAVQRLVAGERGLLISYGRDGARCWDTATGTAVGTAADPLPAGVRLAAAWLPGGRLILGSGVEEGILRCDGLDGTVFDLAEGRCVWDVTAGRLPDGRVLLAATGDHGVPHRWDAVTGEPLPPSEATEEPCRPATLDPDTAHRLLVTEYQETVRCWDVQTGQSLGIIADARSAAVVSLPDGRRMLAAGYPDGGITITPLRSGPSE